MTERALHGDLKKRLINNESFVYTHLIKYERPYAYQTKRALNNTDAKRYAYLTDGAINISFDDGSVDSSGSSNGSQVYIADKILAIGSYSETSEAKATGLTLTLSSESLHNSILLGLKEYLNDKLPFNLKKSVIQIKLFIVFYNI